MEGIRTPNSRELLSEIMRERLPREYAEYVERVDKMSEKEEADLLKAFDDDRDKMQLALQEEKEKNIELFARATELQKIAWVTNNFHSWLPGGLYRTVYESRGKRDERIDALLSDIDAYIKSRPQEEKLLLGYGNSTVPEEKRHEWLATIFLMFCTLKDKGHDADLMWR